MELGAMEDRACSEVERKLIIKEAEELYNKHLTELKLLGIHIVNGGYGVPKKSNYNQNR